jgi:LemA protein
MTGFLIALLVIAGLLVIWFIAMYNRIVALRNNVDASWKQVDVQLQKRYDLIPNLVETVKGYAAHEKETLERVIQARNAAMSAGDNVAQHAEAENMLTGALKSIFALSEAYPDLKANQNFLMLQQELSSIENKIAYSRQHYNDVVNQYNTVQQQFPSNLVAPMAGAKPAEYFELTEPAARDAVKVDFAA